MASSLEPRSAADLAAHGSVEMSAHRPQDARALAAHLPQGAKVYINHLPRNTLEQSLAASIALRAAGLDPVPHLAARRIKSEQELRSFLERAVREAGVQRVLAIGGDVPDAAGPYGDSVALVSSGVLAQCGIREVGMAGYPDGHPGIPSEALQRALRDKKASIESQGMTAVVITQFCLSAEAVVEFCRASAAGYPDLPVRIGLAGPTDTATLLRFAQSCGVRASLRGLRSLGFRLLRLATQSDPGDQLAALASYRQSGGSNLAGAHFFSFGGAERTAAWMRRV